MSQRVIVLGSYAASLVNFRGPLIAAICQAGHTVTACAPEHDEAVAAQLAEFGARFQSVTLQRTSLNPLADLGTFRALRRLFLNLKPDLVLTYTAKPVIYGSIAAQCSAVPKIYALITGLGYAFTPGNELRRRAVYGASMLLYRSALAHCDGVFFQNRDDRTEFRDRGILPRHCPAMVVNGSGIDLKHFSPQPQPSGPIRFLLIARLIADKGIREYVAAAEVLKRRYPELCFRLVGPQDSNPAAISERELAYWQENGIVEYFGELADIRPALRECSVYVLPSYREGMPRTVLEAMAIGRPIITTNAPGCRETVIPGENGFLVPPRNVNALAAAMERFIIDPTLMPAMGARSRALAEERFDVHKVNAAMLDAMGLS